MNTADATPALVERLDMLWEAVLGDTDREAIAYDLAKLLDEIDPQPLWSRTTLVDPARAASEATS